jgi:hypothetical protein
MMTLSLYNSLRILSTAFCKNWITLIKWGEKTYPAESLDKHLSACPFPTHIVEFIYG